MLKCHVFLPQLNQNYTYRCQYICLTAVSYLELKQQQQRRAGNKCVLQWAADRQTDSSAVEFVVLWCSLAVRLCEHQFSRCSSSEWFCSAACHEFMVMRPAERQAGWCVSPRLVAAIHRSETHVRLVPSRYLMHCSESTSSRVSSLSIWLWISAVTLHDDTKEEVHNVDDPRNILRSSPLNRLLAQSLFSIYLQRLSRYFCWKLL